MNTSGLWFNCQIFISNPFIGETIIPSQLEVSFALAYSTIASEGGRVPFPGVTTSGFLDQSSVSSGSWA